MHLKFIGKTEEIVYCSELGVYEKTKCAGSIDVLTPCVIPFSFLLSLDPLMQSNVRSMSVFLTKYMRSMNETYNAFVSITIYYYKSYFNL